MKGAATPLAAATGIAGVRLHVAGGRVVRAEVSVDRPAAAARKLLLGKTPEEALKLAPLLFAVCGVSHAAAGVAACEQALGIDAAPAHKLARRMLAAADALNGHARFIALDWPQACADDPRVEEYALLRKGIAKLLPAFYPERDAFALGGGDLKPDLRAAAAAVRQISDAIYDILQKPRRLRALLDVSIPTPPPRLLPLRGADWFAARLSADPAFAEAPDDDGEPALNAPAAIYADEISIGELLQDCGLSIIPLFMARHVAAMAAIRAIVLGLENFINEEPFPVLRPSSPQPRRQNGEGCGVTLAARGQLAHWVRILNGRVAEWRAVAPTEWNFHPNGPLARALVGAQAEPQLALRVERLVCALDPCVPWRVDIVDSETGGGDA